MHEFLVWKWLFYILCWKLLWFLFQRYCFKACKLTWAREEAKLWGRCKVNQTISSKESVADDTFHLIVITQAHNTSCVFVVIVALVVVVVWWFSLSTSSLNVAMVSTPLSPALAGGNDVTPASPLLLESRIFHSSLKSEVLCKWALSKARSFMSGPCFSVKAELGWAGVISGWDSKACVNSSTEQWRHSTASRQLQVRLMI